MTFSTRRLGRGPEGGRPSDAPRGAPDDGGRVGNVAVRSRPGVDDEPYAFVEWGVP